MLPEQRRDSAGWVAALEQMESELQNSIDEPTVRRFLLGTETSEDAARLATRPLVPEGIGPLPAELGERAQALLAAQRRAIEKLDALQRETGRHLAAMRTIPSRNDSRSVYLDTSG